jgi:hypothetical protein
MEAGKILGRSSSCSMKNISLDKINMLRG